MFRIPRDRDSDSINSACLRLPVSTGTTCAYTKGVDQPQRFPLRPIRSGLLLSQYEAPHLTNDELSPQVTKAYLAGAESWQGCDWTTSFGPQGLELCGLKAKQTRLLAEATSGEESEAWDAATHWLEQVERHARDAQSAASSAVELFTQQQWVAALARAEAACELESQYHARLVWGPLRDLMAAVALRSRRISVVTGGGPAPTRTCSRGQVLIARDPQTAAAVKVSMSHLATRSTLMWHYATLRQETRRVLPAKERRSRPAKPISCVRL